MTQRKERLTVTVDPTLLAAGHAAVAAGRAGSLSAWVSVALADHITREARLVAMADAVAQYEEEFGVITEREIAAQARADRAAAVVVRRAPARPTTGRRGRRASRGAA